MHGKCTAFPQFTLEFDTATVHRGVLAYKSKSQTRAAIAARSRRVDLHKLLKYSLAIFLGNADTRIGNAQQHFLGGGVVAHMQRYRSTRRRKFHGIAAQVFEHMANAIAIASNKRHISIDRICKRNFTPARQGSNHRLNKPHDIAHVNRLHHQLSFSSIEPAHFQNVINHEKQYTTVRLNLATNLRLFFVYRVASAIKHFRKSYDRRKGRTQFVAHHAKKVRLIPIFIAKMLVRPFKLYTLSFQRLIYA